MYMEYIKIIKLSIIMSLLCVVMACAPAYDVRVVDTPQSPQLKGHQKPYIVNGQRYEPLRDHNGFVQEGGQAGMERSFMAVKPATVKFTTCTL